MKGRRWDKALPGAVAEPTPLYPYPNAYDLRLNVDHPARTLLVGPSNKLKDPQGRFDRADLIVSPTATPRYITGWRGTTQLIFKMPTKGPKKLQIDYLDVKGDLLGMTVIEFVVL
jgi:hypothetical protein